MKIISAKYFGMLLTLAAASLAPQFSRAAEADLDCKLHFSLTSWSAIWSFVATGGGKILILLE